MADAGRDDVEELTLEPVTVVRSRRPRALWGVLAAVAVAAGALVVVSAGDDGTSRPGLPVALGSSVAREGSGAAADAMLAWVTYVAGGDLPALGGEAPAYRLAGSVDEARVRALADALGVDGTVVHEGGAWRVVGDAGTVEVYQGGGAQWWYSSQTFGGGDVGSGSSSGSAGVEGCADSSDDVVSDCGVATATTYYDCGSDDYQHSCPYPGEGATTTACSPDTRCATPPECAPGEDCPVPLPEPIEPPAPPVDLPSEDEARAIALDLLAATGLDTDGAVVTVDGPYDAWYVTVEPRVDGVTSGLLANVSVGSEGEVTNAAGYLGDPEALGDYPLLTTQDAIDRANATMADGGWSSYGTAEARDTGFDIVDPSAGRSVVDRIADCEAAGGPGTQCASTLVHCGEAIPVCNTISVVDPPVTTSTAACEACDPIDEQPAATGVDAPATTLPPCKEQPDGSELCETIICPQRAEPGDDPAGAPQNVECAPLEPMPTPEPVEVVLVHAEATLLLLGAVDGSADAYLVPGYRFTDADGGRVDLPAVADEALTGTPETTVPPDSIVPDPGGKPPVDPQPCGEVLVQEDESGTTHTVQPNPDCEQQAERVELVLHCVNIVDWHGLWWSTEAINQPDGWVGTGTITQQADGSATYVDDGAPDDPATFIAQGAADEYPGCD